MRQSSRALGILLVGWAAVAFWSEPASGLTTNCAMCLPSIICDQNDNCWAQDVCRVFRIGGFAECRWSFMFCSESPYNYCVLAGLGVDVSRSRNWLAKETLLPGISLIPDFLLTRPVLEVRCS